MIDNTELEAQIRDRVHGPEDGEAFRKAVAAKGGFKRKPKVYRLDFTDTALDGLTVRAHSAPIGLFMQLGTLADELEGSDDNTDTGMTAMLRTIQELVDVFAQVLVSWDLVDDDDQPVPATAEGPAHPGRRRADVHHHRVAERGGRGGAPFAGRIERWLAVPGGVDADGATVSKPGQLSDAEFILTVCERFGCLPSALLAEDASLMRMLKIEYLGKPESGPDDT
jgi:hypothetical protein